MQRYKVAASSSSSSRPTPTKPVHIADYASYDEESLLRHVMDLTGKSREQVTQDCQEQWGGIDKFLDFCRKEKETSEKCMRGEGLRLGRKPNADEKVVTFPLTDEVSIRVYGGDLAQSYAFHFDFFHEHRGPIKKPSDIRVYTEHGAEVFSIFESLRQSTAEAPWVMQLDVDNSDGHTFIIPEGTMLRIVCPNKQPYLLRIPIRCQGVTVLPIDHVW